MKPLYVAATGQHIGKTTSTLGLVANMKDKGRKVGYCKPVGQNHVTIKGQVIDKDVALFSQVLGFDIDASLHSPVVIGKGVTKAYIDHPEDFHFRENIMYAAHELEQSCDMVVYEGTGHPGVGSVTDVSNADVARMLKAGVVMIAEGGIGNTIDRLTLCLAQFRQYDIPILGVIINKVIPEKKEQVEHYVGKKMKQFNLDLLGVLPFDKRLSFPIMETINQAVKGRVLVNEDKLDNRVEDIVAGSLVDHEEFSTFDNLLLVVSLRRLQEAIEKVEQVTRLKQLDKSPIAGIIITGDGRHERWYNMSDIGADYAIKHKIPVITTELDTYGSVVKISRIEVKINTRTPWKTERAIQLIQENVNVDRILNKMELLQR